MAGTYPFWPGYPGPTVIEFRSSQTWVVPPNVDQIFVTAVSAGGGGGGGHNTAVTGGGGGGGGAGKPYHDFPVAVTPGETLTINVGASGVGGVGGASPTNGTGGGLTDILRAGGAVCFRSSNSGGGIAGTATTGGNGGGVGGSSFAQPGSAGASAGDAVAGGMFTAAKAPWLGDFSQAGGGGNNLGRAANAVNAVGHFGGGNTVNNGGGAGGTNSCASRMPTANTGGAAGGNGLSADPEAYGNGGGGGGGTGAGGNGGDGAPGILRIRY